MRSLDICLVILEDLLYSTCTSLLDVGSREVISKVLMDGGIIKVEFLRYRAQLILCLLLDQQEGEKMQSSLTIASKIVTEGIKPSLASAVHDHEGMLVLVRKMAALAQYPGNRSLMRQNGLLEVLEVTLDKFAGSKVEDQLAGLICSLLSDEQQEPFQKNIPKEDTTDPCTGTYAQFKLSGIHVAQHALNTAWVELHVWTKLHVYPSHSYHFRKRL